MARKIFNWSRTRHCTPTRFVQPGSEDELRELVREARELGTTIKVVGARHSWSAIAMGDGILVSLDGMQAVLDVDAARGRVRVQAGIRLHRLDDELAARGLALTILGSVTEQSVAGVMSTGTHGSSLAHGNISSFVVGLRLVTGTGEVLELGEDDPLLPLARVGLGALGVITEVTLRVEPAFRLRETTEVLSFDAAVADVDAIARSAEYVKLWWLPHTDAVMVFRYERTDAPGRVSPLVRWLDAWVVNKLLFRFLLWLARHVPGLVPAINRLVARTYLDRDPRIDRSDLLFSVAMPPRHREMEYALPVEEAGPALERMRELIVSTGVRVNFIQELRFVKADDAWMSPASGRDTCQLGAYMGQAPGIDGFFTGFEDAMKQLGGRPHWGKELGATADEIARMYPRAEAFAAKARELDPDGVFRNRFLDRVLPGG